MGSKPKGHAKATSEQGSVGTDAQDHNHDPEYAGNKPSAVSSSPPFAHFGIDIKLRFERSSYLVVTNFLFPSHIQTCERFGTLAVLRFSVCLRRWRRRLNVIA